MTERALLPDGSQSEGHSESVIKLVCARLKINSMSLERLEFFVSNFKTGDYKDKYTNGVPMFPALILHKDHASLAFLDSKKKFSYRHL